MKTLTVAKLIELLQDQSPDAKVIFSTNYGDYSRTQQALPLRGDFDEVTIEKVPTATAASPSPTTSRKSSSPKAAVTVRSW